MDWIHSGGWHGLDPFWGMAWTGSILGDGTDWIHSGGWHGGSILGDGTGWIHSGGWHGLDPFWGMARTGSISGGWHGLDPFWGMARTGSISGGWHGLDPFWRSIAQTRSILGDGTDWIHSGGWHGLDPFWKMAWAGPIFGKSMGYFSSIPMLGWRGRLVVMNWLHSAHSELCS